MGAVNTAICVLASAMPPKAALSGSESRKRSPRGAIGRTAKNTLPAPNSLRSHTGPGAVELLEIGEQPRNVVGFDARPAVRYLDAEHRAAFPLCPHLNLASLGRELDGVGKVVVDHLFQPRCVRYRLIHVTRVHRNGNLFS